MKRLKSAGRLEVLDIVPAYDSLAVYFDPARVDGGLIRDEIGRLLTTEGQGHPEAPPVYLGKRVELPVRYGGPDLRRVAEHHRLSPEEVVRLHVGPVYLVAMIGFQPHFPYLLGLPPDLATPRLDSPRTRVPAGSVAIGGSQTGVYPGESPGGWNLIGTTDPGLLTSLEPGDEVVFRQI